MADIVGECYRTDGPGETIVVTRSNKRATAFNLGIRQRILDLEEELCKGERLLVAKNNYTWATKVKDLDFIANGDVAVVSAIHATEERYGFRFAIVTLSLPDRDFNALQVKYAYAVTCHKAQGAQWRNVFVDLGGIPPESQGIDFYRWLYTAVSRATRRLFLLNPGEMSGD